MLDHLTLDHLMLDHLTVWWPAWSPIRGRRPHPARRRSSASIGFIKWVAGASLIACFLGGIVAFTAGRLFDHHRTGRMGLIFMMAAGVGAILFAVGPQILNTLAR